MFEQPTSLLQILLHSSGSMQPTSSLGKTNSNKYYNQPSLGKTNSFIGHLRTLARGVKDLAGVHKLVLFLLFQHVLQTLSIWVMPTGNV